MLERDAHRVIEDFRALVESEDRRTDRLTVTTARLVEVLEAIDSLLRVRGRAEVGQARRERYGLDIDI